MTVKEYFKNLEHARRVVARKREALGEMRSRLEYQSHAMDEYVTGSRDVSHARTNALVKLVDSEEQLDKMAADLIGYEAEAMKLIDELQSPVAVSVFYGRYFQSLSWDEIADRESISIQWAYTLHGRGLQSMKDRHGDIFSGV